MNTLYLFHLAVETPDGKLHRQALNVEAFKREPMPFRPIDRCDSAVVAMMASGHTPTMASRIDSERKQLAQQIAAKLTDGILDAIKAQDTINGYQQ